MMDRSTVARMPSVHAKQGDDQRLTNDSQISLRREASLRGDTVVHVCLGNVIAVGIGPDDLAGCCIHGIE
jgi:hypothetical protein